MSQAQPSDDTALRERKTLRLDEHRQDRMELAQEDGHARTDSELIRDAIDEYLEARGY